MPGSSTYGSFLYPIRAASWSFHLSFHTHFSQSFHSIIWINVMSRLRPARLEGFSRRNFNSEHYRQTFRPALLIPVTGTIDFYHFSPFSLTLTLLCSHKIRQKEKPVGLIFSLTFHLVRMEFDVMIKQFKLNIMRLFLSEIYWKKGMNCCFYCLHQKTQCWHAQRHLYINLIEAWHNDRYRCTVHFDTWLIALDLNFGSQECEKPSVPII